MKRILLLITFILIVNILFTNFAFADEFVKLDVESLKKAFYDIFKDGKAIHEDARVIKDLIIDPTKPYKIKITYANSMASKNNNFGYFVYQGFSGKPVNGYYQISPQNIEKETIIFNKLKSTKHGQSIEIGPFSPNQQIGFFLETDESKYYTVKKLNNDKMSRLVAFKDTYNDTRYVSLGFEDAKKQVSDFDYNDAFFVIQVNDENYDFHNIENYKNARDEMGASRNRLSGTQRYINTYNDQYLINESLESEKRRNEAEIASISDSTANNANPVNSGSKPSNPDADDITSDFPSSKNGISDAANASATEPFSIGNLWKVGESLFNWSAELAKDSVGSTNNNSDTKENGGNTNPPESFGVKSLLNNIKSEINKTLAFLQSLFGTSP